MPVAADERRWKMKKLSALIGVYLLRQAKPG
jgi:hypothetical protein